MRNIMIRDLVLEITRECNMFCKHCLRGNEPHYCRSYVRYMGYNHLGEETDEIFDQIFKGISEIDCITFSGGEPTLNVGFIVRTVDYVIKNGISVNGIFIATNGKIYSQEMVDAVKKLHNHWIKKQFGNSRMNACRIAELMADDEGDKDFIGNFSIAVSLDEYHESIPIENYIRYRTSGLYSKTKENIGDRKFPILRYGRAKDNGLDGNYKEPSEMYFESKEEELTIAELVYVNSMGNVYGDCNLSYQMMGRWEDKSEHAKCYGDISDSCLYDIIKKAAELEEEKCEDAD